MCSRNVSPSASPKPAPRSRPSWMAAIRAYLYSCNHAANEGELDPHVLAMALTPNTLCASQVIADIVNGQTAEGAGLFGRAGHGCLASTRAALCPPNQNVMMHSMETDRVPTKNGRLQLWRTGYCKITSKINIT